ncbi:MAG TPA: hypothetical protein VMV37_15100, partial [Gammaproteobacteria bacterium]|nr:hypothetical protein [Gammaproteobacteria bacterium]
GMQDLATDAKRVYAATWGGQQPTQQPAQTAPAQPTQKSAQATAAPAPSAESPAEPDTRASAN